MEPVPGHETDAEERRPPVVCFVGRKNSGKTTLVEKVIAGLKRAGYRVAAVKHDAHRFEIDHPGRDSYRFTAAGADTTVVSSRDKTAVVLLHGAELHLETIVSRFGEGVDIVLVEGYKASGYPKIEVHRRAAGGPLLAPPPPGLIAVATDERVETAVPQLSIDDPAGVLAFLAENVLRRS